MMYKKKQIKLKIWKKSQNTQIKGEHMKKRKVQKIEHFG